MIGAVIDDKYRAVRHLRTGRIYDVYEAQSVTGPSRFLLKLYSPDVAPPGFWDEIKPNMTAAACLQRAGINPLSHTGQTSEGGIYTAEAFELGGTLEDYLEGEGNAMNLAQAFEIALRLADALAFAHEKGLAHGALSPEAVYLGDRLQPKLTDFYLPGFLMRQGMPAFGRRPAGYFAPETAVGESGGKRADVYSAGVLFYRLATGRMPAPDVEGRGVAGLRRFNPDVPPILDAVALKCLKEKPSLRYADAAELLSELRFCQPSVARTAYSGALNAGAPARREAPAERGARPDGGDLENNAKFQQKMLAFNEGPEVGEELVGPEEKKGRLAIALPLVLIMALAGLGAFVLSFLHSFGFFDISADLRVPDARGLSRVEAFSILGAKGLKPAEGGSRYSQEYKEGVVIDQTPLPGARVRKGREVALILSLGDRKVKIPDLAGMGVEEAADALIEAGMVPGDVEYRYDQSMNRGQVIATDPPRGEEREIGGRVNLAVSQGEEPRRVAMPALAGLSLSEARSRLEKREIRVEDVQYIPTRFADPDFIVGQSVLEGALLDEEEGVVLYVASRPRGNPAGIPLREAEISTTVGGGKARQNVRVYVFDEMTAARVYSGVHSPGDVIKTPVLGAGETRVKVYVDGKATRELEL